MKRYVPAVLCLAMLPAVVLANPTVRPGHAVASIVVILTAFGMELIFTTGYLTIVGLSAGAVFLGLLVVNLASYLGVLLPGLDLGVPVTIMEIVIVSLEAVAIKFMSCLPVFQADSFADLRWRHAFIAAAIGNAVSYGAGSMIS